MAFSRKCFEKMQKYEKFIEFFFINFLTLLMYRYHATRPSMSCDGLVCTPEEECVNVLNPSTGQLQRFHSPPLVSRRTNSTFTNGT